MDIKWLKDEAELSSFVAKRCSERATLTCSKRDHLIAELQHSQASFKWDHISDHPLIDRDLEIEAIKRAIDHSNQSRYHFHTRKNFAL